MDANFHGGLGMDFGLEWVLGLNGFWACMGVLGLNGSWA